MSSCCCSPLPCCWEAVETRSRNNLSGYKADGDVTCLVAQAELATEKEGAEDRTRMDIALLTEQYQWTKEKQKRQTSVVLFRETSEQWPSSLVGSRSSVSVVSVNQEATINGRQSRDAAGDPVNCDPLAHLTAAHLANNPWHTHLSVHRQTRIDTINNNNCSGGITVKHPPPATSTGPTDSSSSSRSCSSMSVDSVSQKSSSEMDSTLTNGGSVAGSYEGSAVGSAATSSTTGSTTDLEEDVVEKRTCQMELGNHQQNETRTSSSSTASSFSVPKGLSRKFSAPASMLTRQLSFGGGPRPAWSSQSQDQHYPFPKMKPPRKSELARKLGLYSSF